MINLHPGENPPASRIYAKALFNVSGRTGTLNKILEEIDFILDSILTNKNFKTFLEGPHIRRDNKHDFIKKVFRKNFNTIITNLFHVLIDMNRQELATGILEEFKVIYEESHGYTECDIHSAIPLDKTEQEKICRCLEDYTGKKLHMRYFVNPELIGGVLFYCEDLLIDHTLLGHLERLKEKFDFSNIQRPRQHQLL